MLSSLCDNNHHDEDFDENKDPDDGKTDIRIGYRQKGRCPSDGRLSRNKREGTITADSENNRPRAWGTIRKFVATIKLLVCHQLGPLAPQLLIILYHKKLHNSSKCYSSLLFGARNAVKVTVEYINSCDPEARFERLMNIIRRDLERQAFEKSAGKEIAPVVPPSSVMEVAIAL